MSDGIPAAPQVWVDADACPGPVKEILFRAAERAQVQVTLVANQWLRTPPSRFIRALQVQGGYDVADDAIAERARSGDLGVTQDIPLAARVLANGAQQWRRRITSSNPGSVDGLDYRFSRVLPVGEALRLVLRCAVRGVRRQRLLVEADEV